MITITNLSKGFTQRTLFKDVNLSIFRGEKIGLAAGGRSYYGKIYRGKFRHRVRNLQMTARTGQILALHPPRVNRVSTRIEAGRKKSLLDIAQHRITHQVLVLGYEEN